MDFLKFFVIGILLLTVGLSYTSAGIEHMVGEGNWDTFALKINEEGLKISFFDSTYIFNVDSLKERVAIAREDLKKYNLAHDILAKNKIDNLNIKINKYLMDAKKVLLNAQEKIANLTK